MIKKILVTLLIVLAILFIPVFTIFLRVIAPAYYGYELSEPVEQPHLYWKDIEVVVENIDEHSWYASGFHQKVQIEVYSEEYNLRKTFEYSDASHCDRYENARKGDIVTAQLYSWVMDSTGEVVRRDIHSLK